MKKFSVPLHLILINVMCRVQIVTIFMMGVNHEQRKESRDKEM